MLDADKQLPNFFVVGAPKAGTTSLYHYLGQHPEVYMSPIKEPNYFASEIRPENVGEDLQKRIRRDMDALRIYLKGPMADRRFGGMVLDWEDYLKLFKNVKEELAIGEASVVYLWSKSAAENIRFKIPGAKIVTILRHPSERALSQYLHGVTNGVIRESFHQHIHTAPRGGNEKFSLRYPFLELGLYYEQVKRYLKIFPKENLHILFFEDYQQQPARSLQGLFRFLNVDPRFTPNVSERQLAAQIPRAIAIAHFLKKYGVWQHLKKLSPRAFQSHLQAIAFRKRSSLVMESRDREYLRDYYREDILNLSNLLDRDLRHWLT
ncbi:MAG: sulfotransferase family protein [Bryobacteraceae bacterium]